MTLYIAYCSESIFWEFSLEKGISKDSMLLLIKDRDKDISKKCGEILEEKEKDGLKIRKECLYGIDDPFERRDNILEWIREMINDQISTDIYIVGNRPREFYQELCTSFPLNKVFKSDMFVKKKTSQKQKRHPEQITLPGINDDGFGEDLLDKMIEDADKSSGQRNHTASTGTFSSMNRVPPKKNPSHYPPPKKSDKPRTVDRRSVQESILAAKIVTNAVEKKVDEVANAKALLVQLIQDRFKRHIRTGFHRKDIKFDSNDFITNKQLMNFMLFISQSETEVEFNISWQAYAPNSPMVLKEDEDADLFKKLKAESNYYVKLCEMLYGGDEWQY